MTLPQVNTAEHTEGVRKALAKAKADGWIHPTADWCSKSNGYVAAHCNRGGPRPIALYSLETILAAISKATGTP